MAYKRSTVCAVHLLYASLSSEFRCIRARDNDDESPRAPICLTENIDRFCNTGYLAYSPFSVMFAARAVGWVNVPVDGGGGTAMGGSGTP